MSDIHHFPKTFLSLGLALALAVVTGCGQQVLTRWAQARPKTVVPAVITVSAAASTTNAVEEIAARYEAATGVHVRVNTGSSSSLANQIISGAPADLYLSANQKWAEAVDERQLSLEMRNLLGNELVIIVPKGNPAGVHAPADLAAAAVRNIALAGEDVPAGMYAERALRSLQLYRRLGEQSRIVRGQNVRVALSYVERGEAEAGIVYRTDAMISDDVEAVFTFDPKSYGRIVYPVLLLKGSESKPAARRFFDYLQSPDAVELFKKYGFEPLT